jgi:hypothetical protein
MDGSKSDRIDAHKLTDQLYMNKLKPVCLRVYVQTVGLNAETKKDRHRADGESCLLTFPFNQAQRSTAAVSLRFHFFGRNVLNAVAAINTCASAGSTDTSFIPPYEFCPTGVLVRK